MRISDWSSDGCSSDLSVHCANRVDAAQRLVLAEGCENLEDAWGRGRAGDGRAQRLRHLAQLETVIVRVAPQRILDAAFLKGLDRKSVVSGKSVSVRVDLGGRRISTDKQKTTHQ